jgi:hypothetical protein
MRVARPLACVAFGVALAGCRGGAPPSRSPPLLAAARLPIAPAPPTPALPTPSLGTPAPPARSVSIASSASASVSSTLAAPRVSLVDLAREKVAALGEAMSRHDAKTLASLYAEGAAIVAAREAPVRGRAAIAARAQRLFDAFSSLKVRAARAWIAPPACDVARREGEEEEEDGAAGVPAVGGPVTCVVCAVICAVICEWVMTGTHSGEYEGRRATERPIGLLWASIVWLDPETGLAQEEHTYADRATLLAQIGASKGARAIPALPATTEWHVGRGGPEEASNVALAKELRGATTTVTRAWGVEDVAILESSITGALEIAQLRDGRIAREWTYGDANDVARARAKTSGDATKDTNFR